MARYSFRKLNESTWTFIVILVLYLVENYVCVCACGGRGGKSGRGLVFNEFNFSLELFCFPTEFRKLEYLCMKKIKEKIPINNLKFMNSVLRRRCRNSKGDPFTILPQVIHTWTNCKRNSFLMFNERM